GDCRHALFLAVSTDAGIQTDAVYPRRQFSLAFKTIQTAPYVYQHFLKQIVHLVLVFGEHIANGIDGTLIFFDETGKFFFAHAN
ncbi:hypothetical protein RFY10_02020, partial [Acinetobacter baumannii]|nr:hypothetical protein [Acinetobacter baumannii]